MHLISVTQTKPTSPTPATKIPRWERKLLKPLTIATITTSNSLSLKVEIQTTDTAQILGLTALLDSGATGLFIDKDFVKNNHLTTRPLTRPIPVYNVDGTPNRDCRCGPSIQWSQ